MVNRRTAVALLAIALITRAAVAADDAPPAAQAAAAGKSFQIESVAHPGRLVRPEDAKSKDGTPIVLYAKQAWKCMTWKLDVADDAQPTADTYRLINHFTHKTLAADAGGALVERPATADAASWHLVKLDDATYRIEQPDTHKVLTADDDGNLTVATWKSTGNQKWRLLPRPAKFTG